MRVLPRGCGNAQLTDIVAVLDSQRVPMNAKERSSKKGPFPYYGANGQVDSVNDFLFDGDHVLLAEDGGYFYEPGRGVAYKVTGKFWVNNHAHILKTREGMPEGFLVHYLNTLNWQEFVTGTTRAKLTQGAMARISIPVPPLPEQRRIVAKIEALMARSRNAREVLSEVPALLTQCRNSVLEAATNGDLTQLWREQQNRAFSWKQVRLDQIAEIQGGVTKDSKKQQEGGIEVPYLRVANVQRGYLDLTEMKTIRIPNERLPALLLEPGDVLFNEGGDLDKLGRGWIWEGQIAQCSFQNHVFRARLFNLEHQPKYISWWGNHRGREYFMGSGKQTTNLASINKSMLCALPVLRPPTDEQREIVRRVELLFEAIDRVEVAFQQATTRLNQLDSSILAKAFRGELVPQDPADEPAEVLLARIRSQKTASAPAQPKRGRPKTAPPWPHSTS